MSVCSGFFDVIRALVAASRARWYIALIALLARSYSQDHVVNGTFEGSFAGNGVAWGWVDNSSWAPVTVSYASSSPGSSGAGKCQKIAVSQFAGGSVQFYQLLGSPVAAGRLAHLTMSLKGSMAATVTLQLRKLSAPYTAFTSRNFPVTASWSNHSYDVVMPGSENDMVLMVLLTGVGTVYLDNVGVTDSANPGPNPYTTLSPPPNPVKDLLFGQHAHHHNYPAMTWPAVPFKVIRFWDSKTAWPQLEPSPGAWNWSRLDDLVNRAVASNHTVLLTLGLTPAWASARPGETNAYTPGNPAALGWAAEASNISTWSNYIFQVANRYKGKITNYEVWNEPNNNVLPLAFFSGTYSNLVKLADMAYKVIKSVDSAAMVVSPSVVASSSYLDNFFYAGGAATLDRVGYHFYTGYHSTSEFGRAPERSVAEVLRVRDVMAKYGLAPKGLWNTESGWYAESTQNPDTSPAADAVYVPVAQQGDLIARLYLLQHAQGVETACFYAWDNGDMGLLEPNGAMKPGAKALASIRSWMVGNTMVSCGADSSGNWVAHFTKPGDNSFRVVWKEEGVTNTLAITTWGAKQSVSLYGITNSLLGASQLAVTSSPVRVDLTDFPVVTVSPLSMTNNKPFDVSLSVTGNWGYWSTNFGFSFVSFGPGGSTLRLSNQTQLWVYGASNGAASPTNKYHYGIDPLLKAPVVTLPPSFTTNQTVSIYVGISGGTGYLTTNGWASRFTISPPGMLMTLSKTRTLQAYGEQSGLSGPTNLGYYTVQAPRIQLGLPVATAEPLKREAGLSISLAFEAGFEPSLAISYQLAGESLWRPLQAPDLVGNLLPSDPGLLVYRWLRPQVPRGKNVTFRAEGMGDPAGVVSTYSLPISLDGLFPGPGDMSGVQVVNSPFQKSGDAVALVRVPMGCRGTVMAPSGRIIADLGLPNEAGVIYWSPMAGNHPVAPGVYPIRLSGPAGVGLFNVVILPGY